MGIVLFSEASVLVQLTGWNLKMTFSSFCKTQWSLWSTSGPDRLSFLYNVCAGSLISLSLGFCHVPSEDNNTNGVKGEWIPFHHFCLQGKYSLAWIIYAKCLECCLVYGGIPKVVIPLLAVISKPCLLTGNWRAADIICGDSKNLL